VSTPVLPNVCEIRFDIPLAPAPKSGASDADEARAFERAWRAHLQSHRMTALATPPARAVAARFRICGGGVRPALGRHLQTRLAALPGGPSVVASADSARTDWSGVQVWLSFPASDLPALLRKQHPAKQRPRKPFRPASSLQGHQP